MNRAAAAWAAAMSLLLFPGPGGHAAGSVVAELDSRQTVVLANSAVPESVPLARHYMEARGIPSNHLCVLELPAGETISRRVYDTGIREPLQKFLREQGLIEQVRRDVDESQPGRNGWRTVKSYVRYVVSMYGVPLRVKGVRPFFVEKANRLLQNPGLRDSAAVDSELACLLWEEYGLDGFEPNPWYNFVVWPRSDHHARQVLIAARLDGPEPATVRRMIDDTLAAEEAGLHGRACIDMRSIQDPDYVMGDYWLNEAGERLTRMGWDVLVHRDDALIPRDYPLDDAAIYLGWYAETVAGPFVRSSFRFRPGAIAYHLHSASAKTLRSAQENWAGPLLAAGAAATMGAVDEPYLSLTPDLQIFTDRICSGFSFGESAYMAQRALSWQITVVGDPLYRPFSGGPKDPEVPEALEQGTVSQWEISAYMNRLASQQRLHRALMVGREALRHRDSEIVREKLADLLIRNDLLTDGLHHYQAVLEATANEDKAFRIARTVMEILRYLNRPDEAEQVRVQTLARWPDSVLRGFLDDATP